MGKKKKLTLLLFFGILPFELNGIWNPILSSNPVMYWIVEVLIWAVIPLGIYWVIRADGLLDNKEIGFHITLVRKYDENINVILLILAIIVVAPLLYYCYDIAWKIAVSTFDKNYWFAGFQYDDLVPSTGMRRFLVLGFLALTAGIVEEFYYRGVMYNLFSRSGAGCILYVFTSSLIFSSIHWEGGVRNLFATFMYGVVCATIFHLTKNIWPLVVGHTIGDFIEFM